MNAIKNLVCLVFKELHQFWLFVIHPFLTLRLFWNLCKYPEDEFDKCLNFDYDLIDLLLPANQKEYFTINMNKRKAMHEQDFE